MYWRCISRPVSVTEIYKVCFSYKSLSLNVHMQLSSRDLASIKMTIVIPGLAFLYNVYVLKNNLQLISNREIYAIIILNISLDVL